MEHLKIEDTIQIDGSKVSRYWSFERFQLLYQIFRRPLKLPKTVLRNINSVEKIQETYKLRGFQFGNWSTNEDRFNYLATLYICFYDLNKILKFKGANLGLNKALTISFGARGSGGALAHFEPGRYVINLTRYKRADVMRKQYGAFASSEKLRLFDNKDYRFLNTGGVGSLAHEYGHFIDFYFGHFYDISPKSRSLSGGSSTQRKRIDWGNKHPLRDTMEDLLMAAIWKDETKGIHTHFYKKMMNATNNAYYYMRTEMFARIFETYVKHQLIKQGVHNDFLTGEHKYTRPFYPNRAEIEALEPYMEKLLAEMRKFF